MQNILDTIMKYQMGKLCLMLALILTCVLFAWSINTVAHFIIDPPHHSTISQSLLHQAFKGIQY